MDPPASDEPGSAEGPARWYRVNAPLHLGLSLKLRGVYSAADLRRRCKGDALKLEALNAHLLDDAKLGEVAAPPAADVSQPKEKDGKQPKSKGKRAQAIESKQPTNQRLLKDVCKKQQDKKEHEEKPKEDEDDGQSIEKEEKEVSEEKEQSKEKSGNDDTGVEESHCERPRESVKESHCEQPRETDDERPRESDDERQKESHGKRPKESDGVQPEERDGKRWKDIEIEQLQERDCKRPRQKRVPLLPKEDWGGGLVETQIVFYLANEPPRPARIVHISERRIAPYLIRFLDAVSEAKGVLGDLYVSRADLEVFKATDIPNIRDMIAASTPAPPSSA